MPESAVGMAAPVLAYNLENLCDWSTQMPFIDIMKMMRSFSFTGTDGTKVDPATIDNLDANGWPTEMPEGVESFQGGWAWRGEAAAASREGVYVLTYDGTGTVEMGGRVEVLSQEDGRITFRHSGDGTFRVQISATDPDGTGDYVRDMSIVREDLVELHEAGAIFNPDFIAQLEDVRQIRFMDWMSTNHNPVSTWEDRATLDDVTWTLEGGAPVEAMVALANQVGADPWFCMPHDADEAFIRNFATYVRDNLDPRLKAHVEFSNETWNWGFKQTKELQAMAEEAWGDLTNTKNWGLAYQSKLMTETALIWRDVFGEESDARLVNVLGTQATLAWRTEQLLNPTAWFEVEPERAVNPADVFDAIATTTYFGASTFGTQEMRDGLRAAIADPEIDANAWLAEKLMDPGVRASVPQRIDSLLGQKAVADAYGLDLIGYEGGQHVHQNIKDDPDGVLNAFLEQFVRSEQMADLYQEVWDAWTEIGDGAFMQFTMIGAPTRFGSWGLRDSLDDNNPRAALIDKLGAETSPWWDEDRDATAFQHGVTLKGSAQGDELVGTTEEDFLIGGEGDDLLIGGAGNDGLHGGAGTDTAVFSGRQSDYTITMDGDAWVVSGTDGTDRLVQVEKLMFLDTGTVTPEMMQAGVSALGTGLQIKQVIPEAVVITELGLEGVVNVSAGVVTAGMDSVSVRGINAASALGKELSAAGFDANDAFLFFNGKDAVDIDGKAVRAIYSSLQEDMIDGARITGSALETASKLATIVFGPVAIEGSDAGESMHGRNGDDVFHGNGGNDWLQGGAGDDLLSGGTGRDRMRGDAGADTFVFARGDGMDRIMDMTAEDRVELHGFGAGTDLVADGIASLDKAGNLNLDWGDDTLVFEGHGLEALDWIALDWAA